MVKLRNSWDTCNARCQRRVLVPTTRGFVAMPYATSRRKFRRPVVHPAYHHPSSFHHPSPTVANTAMDMNERMSPYFHHSFCEM